MIKVVNLKNTLRVIIFALSSIFFLLKTQISLALKLHLKKINYFCFLGYSYKFVRKFLVSNSFHHQSSACSFMQVTHFNHVYQNSIKNIGICRVMDCFLSEGMEVIFRIALALLTMGKDELLLQDMEGVIKYFQRYMPAHFEANQETVFKLAFEININQKKMKKLEKEYTTMKTKEKEDEIEIRVGV